MISLGASKIIGCGGAGIVRPGFDVGHVIVPTGAIRDEGTSYHYAPPDAEVARIRGRWRRSTTCSARPVYRTIAG